MVCDTVASERSVSPSELGWKKKEIEGKTVLAIGCTSRELLVGAAKLGAERVSACEIEEQVADELRSIANHEGLPIFVLNKSRAELDPSADAGAIVLSLSFGDGSIA